MTQTILNCNEIPQGKTYPVADLRTAKSIEQLCKYVDAGHPIATSDGEEVRLFRSIFGGFFYDAFSLNGWLEIRKTSKNSLLSHIKLAPLAYRNGRPLHVGDEICIFWGGEWRPKRTITLSNFSRAIVESWRFADEVTS
jgi:hypothetical protein